MNNYHINDFLKKYSQVETRSNVLYAREKYENNQYRYVFARQDINPPLPKEAVINNHHCQIWHRSQKQWCYRCCSNAHSTEKLDLCDAYTTENEAIIFKSRLHVMCNFFMCQIKIWDQTFPSSEHAYAWAK